MTVSSYSTTASSNTAINGVNISEGMSPSDVNNAIREQLKDCHCLVTNMSIASVDAILNRVPVITDGRNVAWAVASREPKFIEKPFKPGKKTVVEWLKFITEQQFTMSEIEDGTAYKLLEKQGVIE